VRVPCQDKVAFVPKVTFYSKIAFRKSLAIQNAPVLRAAILGFGCPSLCGRARSTSAPWELHLLLPLPAHLHGEVLASFPGSRLGFQVTLRLFVSLPVLLPPTRAFPLEKERRRLRRGISGEDVSCCLSVGQSAAACPLRAAFLRRRRGGSCSRRHPEGRSCEEQDTLYQGEPLRVAETTLSKSHV